MAASRARYDAQIYTNDVGNLSHALSREASHAEALGDRNHYATSNRTGSSLDAQGAKEGLREEYFRVRHFSSQS